MWRKTSHPGLTFQLRKPNIFALLIPPTGTATFLSFWVERRSVVVCAKFVSASSGLIQHSREFRASQETYEHRAEHDCNLRETTSQLEENYRNDTRLPVRTLGGIRQLHLAGDASLSGRLCAGDVAHALGSFPGDSVRNALDSSTRGHCSGGRCRSGFLTYETRQEWGHSLVRAEQNSAGSDGFRQLHLTAFPAGGSRPQ